MTCRTVDFGDGVTAIVCTRGERKKKCSGFVLCGNHASLLCDHPLKGEKSGKTCDAPLCASCAVLVGPDRHLCPTHDRWTRAMANQPDPAKLEERKRKDADAWLAELQREELNEVDRDALHHLFPDWRNDWHVVPEDTRAIAGSIERGNGVTTYGRDVATIEALAELTGPKSQTRHWADRLKAENATRREQLAAQQPIGAKVAHVKRAGQTRAHHCHWPTCNAQVPPAMWGCRKHWYMLPKYLRDKIWNTYRAGQEATMTPSRTYVDAAREVEAWIIANHFPNEDPDPGAYADDEPSEQEILGDVGDR